MQHGAMLMPMLALTRQVEPLVMLRYESLSQFAQEQRGQDPAGFRKGM